MKMLFLTAALVSTQAFATEQMQTKRVDDFVAPVVASDNDVPKQAGAMFYTIGEGLKVVNPLGQVEQVTASGAVPVSSGNVNGERIERAFVTTTGVVINESSDWVDGNCTMSGSQSTCAIEAGTFSGTPVCTVTVNDFDPNIAAATATLNSVSATGWVVKQSTAGVGGIARNYSIICMGPR